MFEPPRRRVPRPAELSRLLPPPPRLRTQSSSVRDAVDIADLRRLARRRAPRMVFDYVDGAAESERSLRASVEAFDALTFNPRVLRDVSAVSTAVEVLGRRIGMPLVLGPTGFTRMMHRHGEPAVAHAAAAWGVPYTAYLYGLMAGGEPGVQRVLAILHEELTRTLRLLGAQDPRQLTRDHVTLSAPRCAGTVPG